MNRFDVLCLINVLAILVALLRVRPALLILAANQAITLRALATIERYGKPASQAFLPESVFSNDNLAIAANIFAITSAFTLLFAMLPARKREGDPLLLPKVPTRIFQLLLVYLAVLAISQRTFLSHAYADPDRVVFSANFGGGTAFLDSIFLYEMVRRTRTGEMRHWVGFGLVFLVFLATDFLHGSTGLATGVIIVGAMLIFGLGKPIRRLATIVVILGGLFLISLSVRVLRSDFSTDGGASVSSAISSVQENSARERSSAEGIESMGNGTQYASHVLECITLYEAGESRHWRSIYLPLIYTVEPSFLARPLGIERPREAAWELADYFIHGGGIFVVGELYWNGGFLCVFVVFLALAWFCFRTDISDQHGFAGLVMACNVGPNLLQGAGYGYAQVCRGIINGALMLLLWQLARKLRPGRSPAPLEVSPSA